MIKGVTRNIGKGLIQLMWLGALAAWLVYGLYIYNFAPGHWFELSPDQAVWGVFGDYVGGLLNPFFSFLAFIGVLITVVLQSKQLDVVKEQSSFEEIQRVMATLSSRIDGLLSSAPIVLSEQYKVMSDRPKSVFQLISMLGTWKLKQHSQDGIDWSRWVMMEEDFRQLQLAVDGELTTICLEIEALAWTLNQYATAGGSEMVIEFYKYRYRAVLVWLDSMGVIENHGQIQTVFKPKESSQYMVNNPASPTTKTGN